MVFSSAIIGAEQFKTTWNTVLALFGHEQWTRN